MIDAIESRLHSANQQCGSIEWRKNRKTNHCTES